jgi:antiviral helicase SKI2
MDDNLADISHFYDALPKERFAKEYPFELDDFQKRAILHLERGEVPMKFLGSGLNLII